MKKLYLVAALSILPLIVMARTLTAYEALERVNGSSNEAARKIARTQPMLVASGTYDDKPSYYIFSSKSQAMILSASSLAVPVIGYLDEPVDGISPMPPQLQWWLDQVALAVADAEEQSSNVIYANGVLPDAVPQGGIDLKSLQKSKAAKAARIDIAPLCKTKWNQDSPYNDQCPLSGTQRTYTGCVATAQAQAMKYYNYPESGTGTVSTVFNGKTYSMALDGQTLKWDLMADEYNSSASAAQKEAVATLMKAVGYSVKMQYGLDGSGTQSYYIVRSAVDNFNYDKAADLQERVYYTNDQWSDMLYADLAAGMPILYSGTGEDGGHQFVCDGYRSSDGYFHFNWGWGGAYDGMFSIDALEPAGQGIGGNGTNFNSNQEAIFGFRKPIDGSEKQIWMGAIGEMSGSVSGRNITLEITEGYYNLSPWDSTFDIGYTITDSDGNSNYHNIGSVSLATHYGVGNLTCNIPTSYGDGDYVIAPAYRISGKKTYQPIKIPVDSEQSVKFTIADGNISLAGEEVQDWIFRYWSTGTGFTTGQNFDLYVTAINNNKQSQTKRLFAAVVDPSTYKIMSSYETQQVTITAEGQKELSFEGKILSTCAPGSYYCCIIDADEWSILAYANIDVAASDANISIKDIDVVPDKPIIGETFNTIITLSNTGSTVGSVDYGFYFCVIDPDDENSLRILGTACTASFSVNADTYRTFKVENCQVPSNLTAGSYYYVVASGSNADGYINVEVINDDQQTGIVGGLEADGQVSVPLYDLQGRPADGKVRGIVVSRKGKILK